MNNPTLTIEQDGARYSVQFDRWDGDRPQFHWTIECDGITATGNDLRLGAATMVSEGEALHSLLGFFSAFAEAVAYSRGDRESDNLNLFPESLQGLAGALSADEVYLLANSLICKGDE